MESKKRIHFHLSTAIATSLAVGALMLLNARERVYGGRPDGGIASSPGWPIPFYDRGGAFGKDLNLAYILLDVGYWLAGLATFAFLVEALARSKTVLRKAVLSIALGLFLFGCLYL